MAPTLIQSTQTPNTAGIGAPGVGGLQVCLPNVTLLNNCIIYTMAWGVQAGVTVNTPTDDAPGGSNTYVLAKQQTGSAGFITIASYVCVGCKAGARVLSFTFAGGTPQFVQASASEWAGIATSSAVDGTTGNESTGAVTSWTAGSFTPGTSGDLIYMCGTGNGGALLTSVTPMGSPAFTLFSADLMESMAEQYFVWSSAAVNPTLTVGGGDGYVALAFALKATPGAGTLPYDGGGPPRILASKSGLLHPPSGTVNTLQFPCRGNLLVLGIEGVGPALGGSTITALDSSPNDGWVNTTHAPVRTAADQQSAYIFYSAATVPSQTMLINITFAGTPTFAAAYTLYDITNAAINPFDKDAPDVGIQSVQADIVLTTFTPSQVNELIIAKSDQDGETCYDTVVDSFGHKALFDLPLFINPKQDEQGATGGAGDHFQLDSYAAHYATVDLNPVALKAHYSPGINGGIGNYAVIAAGFFAPYQPSKLSAAGKVALGALVGPLEEEAEGLF